VLYEGLPPTIMQGMKARNWSLRRQSGRWVWWRTAVLAAGVCHVLADAAMAQKRANMPDDENLMMRYLVFAGVVVVIGFTAFLNPKRTHLS